MGTTIEDSHTSGAAEALTGTLLDDQQRHWEHEYAFAARFGHEPSSAARQASGTFARSTVRRILELGCGHGRDALFFAAGGFEVDALDYAAPAIAELDGNARYRGLAARVRGLVHDVRAPLPFSDASVDAVYAHMLLNMAFVDGEIASLVDEAYRVLRASGTFVFSVRSTDDPDAANGRALGAFLREVDGDIIRFYSDACLERFCGRFETLARERFEEGPLPKRLVLVTLRKRAEADASGPDARVTLNEC